MLESEVYREQLKEAAFGSVLLDWVKKMLPKQEKKILLRAKGWAGSVLNYYLLDVSELYVELKAAKIENITFREDLIKIKRVGGYEFAPLSRFPFLALLYGMIVADKDDNAPHHNRLKKAGKLMEFLEEYHPRETEMLRNIVLYNSVTIPKGAWTEQMIIDEIDAHLHPALNQMVQRAGESRSNITININGDIVGKKETNIESNYAPVVNNNPGGKIIQTSNLNELNE